MTQTRVEV